MAKKTSKRPAGNNPATKNKLRNYIIWGAVALGVIALGALLYLNLQEPETLSDLVRSVGLERGHDENVVYEGSELPPVGGIHSGIWQNCGIYDEPVLAKNAVHSMEHGAVWITYRPDLPAGDVDRLRDTVQGEPYVLLTPYEGLKSPVVLTAWGIQLEVDEANDDRIATFIERYEQGPQTPEPGATCQDGTGSPIG
jgi:hypothetical protein